MPFHDDNHKRIDSIRFKSTPKEKAIFEQVAEETGQTLSNWIRQTLRNEVLRMKEGKDPKGS